MADMAVVIYEIFSERGWAPGTVGPEVEKVIDEIERLVQMAIDDAAGEEDDDIRQARELLQRMADRRRISRIASVTETIEGGMRCRVLHLTPEGREGGERG